jgi:hypothetical protein
VTSEQYHGDEQAGSSPQLQPVEFSPLPVIEGRELDRLPPEQVVEALRQGIGPEGQKPDRVYLLNACNSMQRFIVEGIRERAAQSGGEQAHQQALAWLDASREQAHVRDVSILGLNAVNGGEYKSGQVSISIQHFDADNYSEQYNSFPFKRPEDKKLLRLLNTLSHEAGHATLSGLGLYAVEQYGLDPALAADEQLASHVYIEKHPGRALTGNRFADTRNQEEAGAEGFRNIGMSYTMRQMGYSDQEVTSFLRLMSEPPDYNYPKGHNQIDVLKRVTADKGPHELLPEEAHGTQKNPGLLGYAKPLQPDEVLAALDELPELLANANQEQMTDPKQWGSVVKRAQEPDVRDYLKGMRRERKMVLHPYRKRLIITGTAAVALSAVLAVGGAPLSEESPAGQSQDRSTTQTTDGLVHESVAPGSKVPPPGLGQEGPSK